MTTELKKQVARRAVGTGVNRKPFTVILAPGDVIGFRDHKSRRIWWTSLQHCYAMAVRQTVAFEKAERARARKAGRAA